MAEVDRYSPFPPLKSPTPRKRESPARPRPKSRYEYVKAHRYSTQAPLLQILPVQVSLTDGTPIPPPTRIGPVTEPAQLDTPPQTPTKEDAVLHLPAKINTAASFGPFAGPLSSHPITPEDTSAEESFAKLFERPISVYSNVATFGRPSTTYERDIHDTGLITPPPSGSLHGHRPSVIHRLFGRRNTRSSSSVLSSPTSSASSPTFHHHNQSTFTLSPGTHYHPNGATCAFCDPSSSASTFQPRSIKRSTSAFSFQTSVRRNTTIYGGEVMSPISEYGDSRKSATFPRMTRKKSIDIFKRKSGGWFRDLEAEEEEEAARLRAMVAQKEKEREVEMRLIREAEARREQYNELGEGDDDEKTVVELDPPPMLPELVMLGESEEDGDLDSIFSEIGKEVD